MSLVDILLALDRRPEEFVTLAAGWMDSASIMGDPRERFAAGVFRALRHQPHRRRRQHVRFAAGEPCAEKKEPDALLKAAEQQCRKIFPSLPDSFAKQSALSALGRVGTVNLRDKVHHRADKVMATVGDKLPDLYLPCNHAV